MSASLTYRRGPLGYAVLLDGKPFGRISNRSERGWQVNVPTLNAAEIVHAVGMGKGLTVFPTVRAAKAAIKASLSGGHNVYLPR